MDNIFGKVVVAGIIILVISAISALLSAKSEVARRIRIVLGVAIVLGLLAIVTAIAGPGGLAIVAVVGGVITWIVKGAK